ncbi:MAG: MFS transporter [Halioglobus sp.]
MSDVTSGQVSLNKASTTQGIVLMLAAVLPVMAVVSLVPVLPLLLQEFAGVEGSEFLVPIAVTVPALCVAIFSPLAGWLSDQVGRKNLLLGAFIVYAAIGVVPYFLSDLKHIIASRVLLGVAEATIMTVATALIGDYFDGERREKWVAIQVGIASISAIILIAIGGILGETLGSRGPFLLYLLALPIALVSAIVLFEPAVHADTQSPHLKGFPFRQVLPLVAITLGVSLLFYTIVVKLGPILMLTAAVTPALIGAAGAAANMGHVGGAIIFGRFKSASGPSLLTAGLTLAALGYFGLSVSESLYFSVASAVCASLGVGIMLPTLLAWTMSILPPVFRGRGTGIWTGTFFLGQFIAPIVAVALEAAFGGLANVLAVYGALALIGALIAFVVARTKAN